MMIIITIMMIILVSIDSTIIQTIFSFEIEKTRRSILRFSPKKKTLCNLNGRLENVQIE